MYRQVNAAKAWQFHAFAPAGPVETKG